MSAPAGSAAVATASRLAPWRRTRLASLGLYGHFVRLAFLKFLAYRLRYYTGVVSYTIFVAGHYYLYRALYAGRAAEGLDATIGGLTVREMVTYVAISWIGRSLYFNNISRDLARMVSEGEIAMHLIKPFHLPTVMLYEAVGEAGFRLVMFTIPIMVVVIPLFGVGAPASVSALGWTLISFALSLLIYSQLGFLVGCLAFAMKNIQGVLRAQMVGMDFLTGVIVPFTFFPAWFQAAVAWLPFQCISYVPVMIYLGKRTGPDLAAGLLTQAAWAVGLSVAARVVWRLSLRRVTVQGVEVDATNRFDTTARRPAARRLAWQARIFGAYFVQFLKMRLAYRVDFLIDTLAVGFSLVIQLAVLDVLFGKVRALDGWSYPQVLFIYGFSLVPLGLFNLVSVNLYGFADEYLIGGRFDRVLLRPVGTLAQVIFESFNVSGLSEILLGLAVMASASWKLGAHFGVTDALALAVLAPGRPWSTWGCSWA